ncbi:Lactose permease [Vanrija pseudolonga]|uniref:Lactose permease n=1 Tax=Vanrija pseudolonga TaxID=143232 RepID=A0AAF1BRR2_9TREE|nr:Lactose permease [Vanrija pseudolonga]
MGAGPAVSGPQGDTSALAAVLGGRDTRFYKGHYKKLTACIVLLLITSMTNGYDGSMMNGLQYVDMALDTWKTYFDNPENKPTLFGVFNAIQNIGGLVGLPFAPYVSDYFGRRFCIFLGCVIMLGATALQSAATNTGMFIAARGLIGFGLSFASVAAPVLITEIAFPTHRGPATSLYNSMWYLGSIVAAWTTYGTFRMNNNWGWRIPSILQGLPSIFQVFLIWFVPESPRWLVDHGKEDRARDVIAKYHCDNNYDDPLLDFEMNEIKERIREDRENKSSSGWKAMFTDKGNLRRLRIIIALAFFCQWAGNGLVSYYLTLILKGIGITSAGHQTLINGILQIYNWVLALLGASFVDRVGRRFLFLTSTAGMCVSFICWTICSATYAKSSTQFAPECIAENPNNFSSNCVALNGNKAAGNAVIAFIFLFYGFYDIAMTPLVVSYTVEITPYRFRSKALMLFQFAVSASLTFNQYVNPIALDAIHWKYYIVFCVFLAFQVFYCYLFVIETRGPNGPLPLEEIAALFEGPGRYGFQKNPYENNAIDSESFHEHGSEKKRDHVEDSS